MALTHAELNRGIAYWRSSAWPQDFHYNFYQDMAGQNPFGVFDQLWWDGFLTNLGRWRALRPRGRRYVTDRAAQRFEALGQRWTECIVPFLDDDIMHADWQHVAPFPAMVTEIKNVASPVFTSKFCHFLAPRIFPVVDNAAMGNPFRSYKDYYCFARVECFGTDENLLQELVEALTQEIKHGKPDDNYPLKCKLVELCLIGRHQY